MESVLVETSEQPSNIDHVWLDVQAGEAGRLRISLSTSSRQSRVAGFDPRVWLGIAKAGWINLPTPGLHQAKPLDYREIELAQRIEYLAYDRIGLEQLLVEKARSAVFAEAWGELYVRRHAGIHQVHSRRGSYAVPEDCVGKDGALQFYFRDPDVRELFLFKFAGQP